MANPTARAKSDRPAYYPNGAIQAEQFMDESGNVVVTTQQATIADAVVEHALNSTFSDTEAEAALDALGVKINAILDVLEAHGLMADS